MFKFSDYLHTSDCVGEGVQERERVFRGVSMRQWKQNGDVQSAAVHTSCLVQTA